MRSKSMRGRPRPALLVLVVVALALTGCSKSSSPNSSAQGASTAKTGGNLIFARPHDILTLDPTKMTDNDSIWTVENIFDTLYTSSPDGKAVAPMLATAYTLSPDKLTWTFTLRSDVKFSNGTPLTSKDVKFSIERVSADPTSAFSYTDSAITSITTPNDTTVVIKTKMPWAPMLADLALFANSIIPANFGGESASAFFAHPIGSGPFMFDHWTKGQELKLLKNPHYWVTGQPYLDSVTFTVVSDDNTRKLQLQGGQVHVNEFPPPSSIAQLKATAGITTTLFPSSRTDFIHFNFDRKPFQDVNVRRAISYAIDRSALIKAVMFGYATPANSILSSALWAYDKNSPGIQFDLAKAKVAMAASSVPTGFKTTLLVGAGTATEQAMGQIIQQELALLNITVTLKQTDPTNEYTEITKGQYEMAFDYDTTDIIDPDEMVMFSAAGGTAGQGTHGFWTNYDNPQVDKWAQQAEVIFDQSQRQELYNKIQRQVANDAPLAFLFYSPFTYAYSNKVHGLTVYPTGNYPLQNVSLN
jgi:peptide/nickel transport system substrate-binding protein